MSLNSKRELIQAIRKVYKKSTTAEKSAHLGHLGPVTGLRRKYRVPADRRYRWLPTA